MVDGVHGGELYTYLLPDGVFVYALPRILFIASTTSTIYPASAL